MTSWRSIYEQILTLICINSLVLPPTGRCWQVIVRRRRLVSLSQDISVHKRVHQHLWSDVALSRAMSRSDALL